LKKPPEIHKITNNTRKKKKYSNILKNRKSLAEHIRRALNLFILYEKEDSHIYSLAL